MRVMRVFVFKKLLASRVPSVPKHHRLLSILCYPVHLMVKP